MEYKIETKYGHGNNQALKIASDISAIDLPDTESVLFDFAGYSENNPFSNLLIANSIRAFRKIIKTNANCALIMRHIYRIWDFTK